MFARTREWKRRSGYFRRGIANIGNNPTVYRVNSINTCPMRAAQDTSYMARHRVLFAMALRRHKSRPMMGYMCRRHATVSCENVSRDPMGPPVIFTSCLLPQASSFPRVYMAHRVTWRSSSSSRLFCLFSSSLCLFLFSPNIVNDIRNENKSERNILNMSRNFFNNSCNFFYLEIN